MKYLLFVILFLNLKSKQLTSCLENFKSEECPTYHINNLVKIKFSSVTESRFNFGYRRLNNGNPPTDSQIFIYPLNFNRNIITKNLQIYFNRENKIILRENDLKFAESEEDLPSLSEYPSWYSFEVILEHEDLIIKRPGELTNLVNGTFKKGMKFNRFDVEFSSRHPEVITFNCLTPLTVNSSDRVGKSLINLQPSSKEPEPHFTIRLGEVCAWIVASLSLCGLVIVGLTLYMKVSQNEHCENNEGKYDAAASVSHVTTAFEMLPYPKFKTSTFYAEVRKPDEGTGAQTDRASVNVISDILYPLDLSNEDDKSNDEDTFRSCDTILTRITNETR